ncbi:DUF3108 domain-containing protein [Plasticicumulans acidivorans]|uniref:Uncharacterized protein DUF3108 n=1 Tax=Plasticicumulans acidivorans TaxID=886464 RepID=A0A317N054_9GAMM|nr:DUF3108 domain-containing protein [Plasticicumulans acidivorans]PWV65951.1 uncharacterized protein DUF3108 [Plasticicumulans acidivorans]
MKSRMRLRVSLALAALALTAASVAEPLPEWSARYALQTRGVTVASALLQNRHETNGSTLTLRVEGGGVSGFLGELGRAELFSVDTGDGSRPLSFMVHANPPFTAATTLSYDWGAAQLIARHGDRLPETLALDDTLADPMAFLVRLLEARRAGIAAPTLLRVPYADGVKEYRIQALGEENLDTVLGQRQTEKYELARSGGGNKVRITVWLSPEDDWLPVLGVRSRKQVEKARVQLEALSHP